jgi:hypothetical protein
LSLHVNLSYAKVCVECNLKEVVQSPLLENDLNFDIPTQKQKQFNILYSSKVSTNHWYSCVKV